MYGTLGLPSSLFVQCTIIFALLAVILCVEPQIKMPKFVSDIWPIRSCFLLSYFYTLIFGPILEDFRLVFIQLPSRRSKFCPVWWFTKLKAVFCFTVSIIVVMMSCNHSLICSACPLSMRLSHCHVCWTDGSREPLLHPTEFSLCCCMLTLVFSCLSAHLVSLESPSFLKTRVCFSLSCLLEYHEELHQGLNIVGNYHRIVSWETCLPP